MQNICAFFLENDMKKLQEVSKMLWTQCIELNNDRAIFNHVKIQRKEFRTIVFPKFGNWEKTNSDEGNLSLICSWTVTLIHKMEIVTSLLSKACIVSNNKLEQKNLFNRFWQI